MTDTYHVQNAGSCLYCWQCELRESKLNLPYSAAIDAMT